MTARLLDLLKDSGVSFLLVGAVSILIYFHELSSTGRSEQLQAHVQQFQEHRDLGGHHRMDVRVTILEHRVEQQEAYIKMLQRVVRPLTWDPHRAPLPPDDVELP